MAWPCPVFIHFLKDPFFCSCFSIVEFCSKFLPWYLLKHFNSHLPLAWLEKVPRPENNATIPAQERKLSRNPRKTTLNTIMLTLKIEICSRGQKFDNNKFCQFTIEFMRLEYRKHAIMSSKLIILNELSSLRYNFCLFASNAICKSSSEKPPCWIMRSPSGKRSSRHGSNLMHRAALQTNVPPFYTINLGLAKLANQSQALSNKNDPESRLPLCKYILLCCTLYYYYYYYYHAIGTTSFCTTTCSVSQC